MHTYDFQRGIVSDVQATTATSARAGIQSDLQAGDGPP